MKHCTLLLLLRDDQILLAMKKRGFGAGLWNGVGGKVDPGETIEQALIRECQEEINVTPLEFTKVAEHDFRFADGTSDMIVHVFTSAKWRGKPEETEEMAPKWFELSEIPYEDMWQDDRHWLPEVLAGKKLHGMFVFDKDNAMLERHIHETTFI